MRASHYIAAASLLLSASAAWAMDNGDLLKLKKAAFSDATIIHTIEHEEPDYDISPDALVALKQEGISEDVIDHVLARQGSAAPAAVVPKAATAPNAAPVTVVANTASPAAETAPPPSTETPAATVATETSAPAVRVAVPDPTAPNLFSIESPSIAPPLEQILPDHDYFTRFTFHEEGGTYATTNYARGSLVPINTPVRVVAMSNRKIALKRLDTGESLYVANVEKYSRKTVPVFASLLLSSTRTPIDRLAPPISSAIEVGVLRRGMTKEQVLMARGYPPAHATPSTDYDRWKYWSSRFGTQIIVFVNGRLTEGPDIL